MWQEMLVYRLEKLRDDSIFGDEKSIFFIDKFLVVKLRTGKR